MKNVMMKIITFIKKETVLSAAWLLALISVFFVAPSPEYAGYIDFRSLGILWSMMVIMAGLKKHGFFRLVGEKLLERAKGTASLVLILVFLCFFFSMLITNDVSLLTFVPFTLTILGASGRQKLVIPVVVLQTLAANLGSMLTPIGNPQNLYLYGISGMSIGSFILLMLPYTAATAVLLLFSCFLTAKKAQNMETADIAAADMEDAAKENKKAEEDSKPDGRRKGKVLVYGILFAVSLFTVLRILPWPVIAVLILIVVFVMEKDVIGSVDYALLATFIGFFIFTGNMGKVPAVASALNQLVQGRETILGILVSQVISNVPAALLLSGFTYHYEALIIGVNLGGLGTLIASMASLISYKFVAREYQDRKGKYFLEFTAANILYLALLTGLWFLIC